jgi:hypothetical protein
MTCKKCGVSSAVIGMVVVGLVVVSLPKRKHAPSQKKTMHVAEPCLASRSARATPRLSSGCGCAQFLCVWRVGPKHNSIAAALDDVPPPHELRVARITRTARQRGYISLFLLDFVVCVSSSGLTIGGGGLERIMKYRELQRGMAVCNEIKSHETKG